MNPSLTQVAERAFASSHSRLERLDLRKNALSTLVLMTPLAAGEFTALKYLSLSENKIKGTIKVSFKKTALKSYFKLYTMQKSWTNQIKYDDSKNF